MGSILIMQGENLQEKYIVAGICAGRRRNKRVTHGGNKDKGGDFRFPEGSNFENRVDIFRSPYLELDDTRASRDCVPLMTIELRVNSIMPRAAQNLF